MYEDPETVRIFLLCLNLTNQRIFTISFLSGLQAEISKIMNSSHLKLEKPVRPLGILSSQNLCMKSKVARKAQLEIYISKSEIMKLKGLKYPYAVQSNRGILAVQGHQPRVDVCAKGFQ